MSHSRVLTLIACLLFACAAVAAGGAPKSVAAVRDMFKIPADAKVVFKSEDGAANWREITGVQPSTFGFTVAVHPADPNVAWFVPGTSDEKRCLVDGRVVVTRTKDGGKTFETITRGLPQQHAYDLVYRHALDVDEHGKTLIFGSTTGSLWVSEDGGDSWQALSSHLPPVYAVTFEKRLN